MLKATLIIWLVIGGHQPTRPVVVGGYVSMQSCQVVAEQWKKETGGRATCLNAH